MMARNAKTARNENTSSVIGRWCPSATNTQATAMTAITQQMMEVMRLDLGEFLDGRSRLDAIVVGATVGDPAGFNVRLQVFGVDAPAGFEANGRELAFADESSHEALTGAQAMGHMSDLEQVREHREEHGVDRHSVYSGIVTACSAIFSPLETP